MWAEYGNSPPLEIADTSALTPQTIEQMTTDDLAEVIRSSNWPPLSGGLDGHLREFDRSPLSRLAYLDRPTLKRLAYLARRCCQHHLAWSDLDRSDASNEPTAEFL